MTPETIQMTYTTFVMVVTVGLAIQNIGLKRMIDKQTKDVFDLTLSVERAQREIDLLRRAAASDRRDLGSLVDMTHQLAVTSAKFASVTADVLEGKN